MIVPNKIYYKIMQYERYIILVVFALLVFGVLSTPLSWLSEKVMFGIAWLISFPFGEYGDVITRLVSNLM